MNLELINNYFYPHRILDIGANTGWFHTTAKSVFPNSYIFSIEANENCEEDLKKITDNYFIGLLSSENVEHDFYVPLDSPKSTGASVYREMTDYFRDDNLGVMKVGGIRLDDLFEEGSEFDLIKIDTQGSEIDIMRGGPDLISRAKGILLEVSVIPYNEGSPLKDEVFDYMSSINFKPATILSVLRAPSTAPGGVVHQEDILFIRN
jgi:FkbM family methyltransferase